MTDNIEVFTQSSIRITGSEGTIYVDPFRVPGEPADADFIFLTHDHYDHYSTEDIENIMVENKTILVVPVKMEQTVKKELSGFAKVITVVPGESLEESGLTFETVASYNINKSFHPRNAGWCGYVIRVDGKRIYIAGDMDATEEAKQVSCDIAMIPIGGTYTMTPLEAAELINVMEPQIAIPTHYGSIVGSKQDGDAFAGHVKDSIQVVKKLA